MCFNKESYYYIDISYPIRKFLICIIFHTGTMKWKMNYCMIKSEYNVEKKYLNP